MSRCICLFLLFTLSCRLQLGRAAILGNAKLVERAGEENLLAAMHENPELARLSGFLVRLQV